MRRLRVRIIAVAIAVASLVPAFPESQRNVVVNEYPGETVTFEYEDGYLVEETSDKAGILTRTVYRYIDGRLSMCISYDEASNESSTVFFLRSPSSHDPVAIKRDGLFTYIGDSRLLQDGQLIESSYVLNDDGSASIVDSGVKYEYSADGDLVRETREDKVVEYSYDEGMIAVRKTILQNGSYEVEHMENGDVVYKEGFDRNGGIEWMVVPGVDGKGDVKTIYDAGRPIAEVHYKEDNVRVDRIEYL